MFADILNSYGEETHTIDLLEENDVIGDPFKYKEFYINFTPKLNKNIRLKYGFGFSSPNFYMLDDPDKYLRSAYFIRVPIGTFTLHLKFEKGLEVKEVCLLIYDINNKILLKKDLNITSKNISPIVLCDGVEGECSYMREQSLYYDHHKFKIEHPHISRLITTQFKVGKAMERSV